MIDELNSSTDLNDRSIFLWLISNKFIGLRLFLFINFLSIEREKHCNALTTKNLKEIKRPRDLAPRFFHTQLN